MCQNWKKISLIQDVPIRYLYPQKLFQLPQQFEVFFVRTQEYQLKILYLQSFN